MPGVPASPREALPVVFSPSFFAVYVASDFLSQLARKKRSAAIDRVAVHAFEDVFEDGSCDHGIEDNWHLRGLGLARAQSAQRALGRNLADLLR